MTTDFSDRERAFLQFHLRYRVSTPEIVTAQCFDGSESNAKKTLHEYREFRFAVFPRKGGRALELDSLEQLEWMGRFIGRLHAVSVCRKFEHRPQIFSHLFVSDGARFDGILFNVVNERRPGLVLHENHDLGLSQISDDHSVEVAKLARFNHQGQFLQFCFRNWP